MLKTTFMLVQLDCLTSNGEVVLLLYTYTNTHTSTQRRKNAHFLGDVIVCSSNKQRLDDVSSGWLFNGRVQCCLQPLITTSHQLTTLATSLANSKHPSDVSVGLTSHQHQIWMTKLVHQTSLSHWENRQSKKRVTKCSGRPAPLCQPSQKR